MQKPSIAFAILVLGVVPSVAISSKDDHPVGKVITLLNGLSAKIDFEAKREEVSYTKFTRWCSNSVKSLKKNIAEEKDAIDQLTNVIDGKTKAVESLGTQIKALEEQIEHLDAASLEADEANKNRIALYEEASSDYEETISAIKECIVALKESKSEDTDATRLKRLKLLQVLSRGSHGSEIVEQLQGFDQERPVLEAEGDYDKAVKPYTFKSGGVIETLKKLQKKFEDELLETTKGETAALNDYELATAAREQARKAATDSNRTKSTEKASAEAALESASTDLEQTQEDLSTDEDTLESTDKSCAMKASEWEERSETRKKEKEAIAAAIEILGKASGVRTEAPKNEVPPPPPVLLQFHMASSKPATSDAVAKVAMLLRTKAKTLHNKAMERLSQELMAHVTGPFDEVNNMIQKMIFHLMAEQKDEDDHKNWCDLELDKTNASKVSKEEKIAVLSTQIEKATADVTMLTEEIAAANDMVAAIEAHKAEATDIRETGKKENALALKDAQEAQSALANAIAVLETFYKESGAVPKEAGEFVQEPVSLPEEPSTWSSSYTGVSDPQNQPRGILAVLETVAGDFARMEADTKAQETMDQEAYDVEMQKLTIEKARRAKEAEMKGQEKKRLTDKLVSMEEQKKHVSGELEAVLKYAKDLEPACVEGDSTYEDRKAARAMEMDALRQAQQILAEAFEGSAAPSPAAAPPSPSPSTAVRRLKFLGRHGHALRL